MRTNRKTDLLLFVVGAELVGILSALFSGGSFGEYYAALTKPLFSPPGWVFPVVWAVLYALTGISAYLVYAGKHEGRNKALRVYASQLFVNFLWSPVFFGLRNIGAAAAVITVLIVLVVVMTVLFAKIDKRAAFLNIPYILWLIFAAYLNFGVLYLNCIRPEGY